MRAIELNLTASVARIVSVSDVYPASTIIPHGFEVIAFRIPEQGDIYLNTLGTIIDWRVFAPPLTEPRLILRRRAAPPTAYGMTVEAMYGKPFSVLTLPEGWRWKVENDAVAFRPATSCERWLTIGYSGTCFGMTQYPRLILEEAK